MNIPSPSARLACIFAPLLASLLAVTTEAGAAENRFEKAIQAFEAQDARVPPPKNAVLFIGSSSIRLWNLGRSFPDLEVIGRGFGGSHISDSIEFASRIVTPYEPRTIVFYAGDNDIAAGKSPETVRNDFQTFCGIVHAAQPDTRILFVAIKPSIRRWNLADQIREANTLVRKQAEGDDRIEYIDVWDPMLDSEKRPRADLLREDGLHLTARGYELWTSLVRPRIDPPGGPTRGRVIVATAQFPVAGDVAANAEWIRRQMREAKQRNADVVHFCEAALSGYPGVDRPRELAYDWERHRRELESILTLAGELRLWVILGSDHRLSGSRKPHNSLYVINPAGEIIERYDKRFCTGGDLLSYSPGDHFATFQVNGVTCGLLICYDVRFPELYREYRRRGAQLIFHSFHNARQKEGAIHPLIMPPSLQARAATNYMFLSVSNSCAPRSWESLFATPDGLIKQRLERDEPGVMVNTVDTTKRFYDASRPFRLDAIRGRLHSGETVDDPRSKDRRAY